MQTVTIPSSTINFLERTLASLEEKASRGDVPPKSARQAAERGLELRKKFGRGGTMIGVARARDIKNGRSLPEQTVRRMKAYFDRHEVDKQGKDWDNEERPSNGKIAWLLWGGDSGRSWATSKVESWNREDGKTKTLPRWLPNGEEITELKHLAAVLCIDEKTAAHCVLDSRNPSPVLLREAKAIVRTAMGSIHYGQPIGATIVADGISWRSRVMESVRVPWDGFTFSFLRGTEPVDGYIVAKQYRNREMKVSDFYDGDKGIDNLFDWIRTNEPEFHEGEQYLGLWHDEEHDEIVFDVSMRFTNREQAIAIGEANNQQFIYDVVKKETIATGGTGDRKALNDGKILGETAYPYIRDDGRRTEELAERSNGAIQRKNTRNKVTDKKHGIHNQIDHGNWAHSRFTGSHLEEAMMGSASPTDAYGNERTTTYVSGNRGETQTPLPEGWFRATEQEHDDYDRVNMRSMLPSHLSDGLEANSATEDNYLRSYKSTDASKVQLFAGPNGTGVVVQGQISWRDDFTPEDLVQNLKQLGALQRVTPAPGLQVFVGTQAFRKFQLDDGCKGFVDTRDNDTIYLRPSALSAGDQYDVTRSWDRVMKVPATDRPSYALTHEYGHVVDRRSDEVALADFYEVVYSDKGLVTGSSAYSREGYFGEGVGGLQVGDKPTGREMYAEAWTGWVLSKGWKAKEPGMVKHFAEKYGWDSKTGTAPMASDAKETKAARKNTEPPRLSKIYYDTFGPEGGWTEDFSKEKKSVAIDWSKPQLTSFTQRKGIRRVRNSRFWGKPVGTIITRGMIDERARGSRVPNTPNSPLVSMGGGRRISPRDKFPKTVRGKKRTYRTVDASNIHNLRDEDQAAQHDALLSVFDRTLDQLVGNLSSLFDRSFISGAFEVGSRWYEDGGNMAGAHAVANDMTREQGCGVFAAMSPMREWEDNVAIGKYIMDIVAEDPVIPDLTALLTKTVDIGGGGKGKKKMKSVTRSCYEWTAIEMNERGLGNPDDIIGLKLSELPIETQALMVRMLSQAGYFTDHPEEHQGKKLGYVGTDKQGNPKWKSVGWASGDVHTAKAINIARATPEEVDSVIDAQLEGMKVRSFYNNLSLGENNEYPDITMDTHAMSAAAGRTYGSNSREKGVFFGGPPESAPYGFTGLYPIFAEAFRVVAAEKGVLPHRMQAILWLQWRHEIEGMPIITHTTMAG